MADALQLSEAAFGPGAGLFFVGYILFEVPSNLILQRVGAKMWIARIMITGAVVHRHHVRHHADPVLRHSLSARRGGGRFSARRALYLTLWFPTYRRGRIIALFMIGLPLSSVIGGPLSGWIMGHFDMRHGLHGWQWLFCWRAFPACCWAC